VYFSNGQEGRSYLRHHDLDYNVAYMQAKSFFLVFKKYFSVLNCKLGLTAR